MHLPVKLLPLIGFWMNLAPWKRSIYTEYPSRGFCILSLAIDGCTYHGSLNWGNQLFLSFGLGVGAVSECVLVSLLFLGMM